VSAIAPPPLTGLCSVSFRTSSCEDIVALARRAGLAAIEWGTDIHVPPGDTVRATHVAELCANASLLTPTLGSYLRCDDDDDQALADTLQVARILGVERIRVWAGRLGSEEASAAHRARVAARLERYCDAARDAGMRIALEYHPDTLTDTARSAAQLLELVDRPALGMYWQPTPETSLADALEQLERIGPRLTDVHVFHWLAGKRRQPLESGRAFWAGVLDHLRRELPAADGRRFAFLEFVRDDDPDQLVRDARTLSTLCAPG